MNVETLTDFSSTKAHEENTKGKDTFVFLRETSCDFVDKLF